MTWKKAWRGPELGFLGARSEVFVNPIPGQAVRNSDHLREEGAALRCNNLLALARKIDALLADEARSGRLRQALMPCPASPGSRGRRRKNQGRNRDERYVAQRSPHIG